MTDVAQSVGTIGPLLPGAPQPQQQQPPVQWGPQVVPMLEGVDISTHVNVGIYGPEGSAKTILAATAPKPLFLDTENSTTSLRDWPELLANCKIARRLDWKSHSDEILRRLKDPNDPWADRETVVLDTLDAWQASNLQAILDGGPTDKYLPMEHHYKKSGEMLRRWLTDLRDLDRFHLIVLVHEKEVFIGEGMGAQRFVRPAVTPKVMSVLWNDFDVVGHLRTFMEKPTDPFANGLQVRSDNVIKAKCRLRHLAPQIPNPHFNHILAAFNKSMEGFQNGPG